MLKAVLDTNVLVSGLLKRGRSGIPDQILRKIDKFELFLSTDILEETQQVLHYPRIQKKYRFTEAEIQDYLDYLRAISQIVEGISTLKVIREDPDDDMILACAIQAQADYVVSGDPHLKRLKTYQAIQIISPAEFLKLL